MERKGRDKGRDGILGLVPKVKRRRISFAAFIILEGSKFFIGVIVAYFEK